MFNLQIRKARSELQGLRAFSVCIRRMKSSIVERDIRQLRAATRRLRTRLCFITFGQEEGQTNSRRRKKTEIIITTRRVINEIMKQTMH